MNNIPKESTCRYCGRRILWIRTERGMMPIESRLIPYKRRHDGKIAPMLWTNKGESIPCDPLPEEREREADGFAHRYHFCPARPRPARKRPMTKREKYREDMA